MNTKTGHEQHGTDPRLENTLVRYLGEAEDAEPGWYIRTTGTNDETAVATGPYPIQELETTLRKIEGRNDDDDHETDLTPEEVAMEEGHVTRIEAAAGKVGDSRSLNGINRLEARKKRLTPLMTAIDDYEEWCAG